MDRELDEVLVLMIRENKSLDPLIRKSRGRNDEPKQTLVNSQPFSPTSFTTTPSSPLSVEETLLSPNHQPPTTPLTVTL